MVTNGVLAPGGTTEEVAIGEDTVEVMMMAIVVNGTIAHTGGKNPTKGRGIGAMSAETTATTEDLPHLHHNREPTPSQTLSNHYSKIL
jgi:type IV secretory pathway protease TraF